MAYLQECYRFGEDAIIWERSLGDSVLESVSWLEDLASFSDEIKLKSEDLVRQSGQDIEALSHLTPQLSELLRAASKSSTGKLMVSVAASALNLTKQFFLRRPRSYRPGFLTALQLSPLPARPW